MKREAKQDLETLKRFVAEYSLGNLATKAEFTKQLSVVHGPYLSFLTVLVELEDQVATAKREGKPTNYLPTPQQLLYLRECASDLGQAIFCWIHGAYKASRVMIRSSIETFVKAICLMEKPTVLSETRVYRIFELATATHFFKSPLPAKLLSELETKYGELCGDVHTANPASVRQVTALKYFPSFVSDDATRTAGVFKYVVLRQLSGVALFFNEAFHAMHHRNKEIVIDEVPSNYRRAIQNID